MSDPLYGDTLEERTASSVPRGVLMKSELVPLNGDPPIPIRRDVTLLGRREYCDVIVPHPSLSKRHCVLVRTDGLLIVRDLISTNGTKVNGQRISWAALLPNDRLTLGRYKFRVYLGPDDVPSPSEVRQRGDLASSAAPALGAKVPGASAGFAAPSPLSIPTFPSPSPPAKPLEAVSDLEPFEDEDGLEFLDDDDDEEDLLFLDLE